MRRKSERTASKKAKASPEKKVEKVKRAKSRRGRKQSSSTENDSAEESTPVRVVEEVVEAEKKPPSTPVKEDSPEETPDQVWQVKTAESSGDGGEIHKLKICLTRPPSTPERTERSPRSKRKHSRATSSSDTPSVEGVEEKKKSKHKSKRSTRDSKEESDKHNDSQGDETEVEAAKGDGVSQSNETQSLVTDETPMSTTNEEIKPDDETTDHDRGDTSVSNTEHTDSETQNKPSDADTTVASPKHDNKDKETEEIADSKSSPFRKRSPSVEKSEILELHASKYESLELSRPGNDKSQKNPVKNDKDGKPSSPEGKVSITEENSVSETTETQQSANKHDVVESSENVDTRTTVTHSAKDKDAEESKDHSRELERSDSIQSASEEVHNGPTTPFVVNRKRRWGSRPTKITSQKSITISTDILKEIIPDVKPAEFEEVIEEKKHKRIEIPDRDKVDRPVLPKIVIDNTDNGEHRKDVDNKIEENSKARDSLGSNRKISIVIENDSIITRPPSPPRHKQSNILYITNLVRPFTLPQLKNLLQRTGRIVENGFWIDRIKSKCFVQYETEDQAIETRHALHGVTWPVSNPKTLQVDFSVPEAFEKAKANEENDTAPTSTIPGTVEDWLREQDMKRERGELQEKPWERKAAMREWDMGKNDKDKEKDKLHRDDRSMDRRRHRTPERSPEPAKKFKKKEEEAPAKLLDDLFRKTKTTPCIYWLPLSAETIAIKEEQRRQHMAEHERRLQELRRTQHRRH